MQVKDIKEFDELLEMAEQNAKSDFEMDFVSDMQTKYDQYEDDCYISDKQLSVLEGIAWGENNYRKY